MPRPPTRTLHTHGYTLSWSVWLYGLFNECQAPLLFKKRSIIDLLNSSHQIGSLHFVFCAESWCDSLCHTVLSRIKQNISFFFVINNYQNMQSDRKLTGRSEDYSCHFYGTSSNTTQPLVAIFAGLQFSQGPKWSNVFIIYQFQVVKITAVLRFSTWLTCESYGTLGGIQKT